MTDGNRYWCTKCGISFFNDGPRPYLCLLCFNGMDETERNKHKMRWFKAGGSADGQRHGESWPEGWWPPEGPPNY